jgi:uncharacterized protein YjbI with pentapeptide repeats
MSKSDDVETAAPGRTQTRMPTRSSLTTGFFALLGLCGIALLLCQLWIMQRQWESLHSHDRERLFWTLCQPSASVAERTAAFRQLAADGHAEWRSAASQGLDLRESRLDDAELVLADLTACDLRDASLVDADLSGCRLRTADLSGADLTNAVLDGADCLRAILDGTEFRKAQMRNCSLEQVQAVGARFVLADLSEALLLMADLSQADFTGANLSSSSIESAKLRGATLALTDLSGSNLTNADFTDSNWWRARGLTDDQLLELAAEFPPSESAGTSRIKDFELWIKSFADEAADEAGQRPVN